MNIKIALIGCIILLFQQIKGQEIPNGNFEVWDLYNTWTLEPEYWSTQNNQLTTPVTQDTLAHEGDFAMRVQVLPGFEGGVQEIAYISFPIAFMPYSMNYWVKASVPDGNDLENVTVTASFYYLGQEVYTDMDVMYDSITTWEQRVMIFPPIDVAVDEIRILVSAGFVTPLGGGSWDTWISIDEMAFSNEVSVSNTNIETNFFYPNPCRGTLYLQTVTAGSILEIYNLQGVLISNEQAYQQNDLTFLPSGMYALKLKTPAGESFQQKIIVE
ncbi:MAG: T9SS type A sorting domain-containing protein [Flavobacteriales bacterium]|nr:T9SS type A sorting domain-containing protein [Flavobacteriales bacterium]